MRFWLALVTLLCASACFGSTTGTLVRQEDTAAFVKGVTTVDEVIAKFGKPTTTTSESSGRQTLTYSYLHLSVDSSESKINAAQFVFGPDKTLDSMTFSDTSPGASR